MKNRAYKARILLVEDDQDLADLLIKFLQEDYDVIHLINPYDALDFIGLDDVNIILLDLSLPQMDGLVLCQKISKISKAKILISSARSAIDDKLHAFKYGAQDYLAKPYDPRELQVRIELLLNKDTRLNKDENLYLDNDALSVSYKDEQISLSTAEFEIFSQLFRHEGQILSREQLANAMDAHSLDSSLDSISVLIGRLRKKMKVLCEGADCIKTIRLSGYKYESI
ncbi:response regulator transcription factor [Sulfurimonas sp. MAG313]|nr:response regulator transcription factor [Sulfurimonas sp. MAG313]MDF1880776.1 response regulator transcription factor [Sulfurimonas sp. MAG313]